MNKPINKLNRRFPRFMDNHLPCLIERLVSVGPAKTPAAVLARSNISDRHGLQFIYLTHLTEMLPLDLAV